MSTGQAIPVVLSTGDLIAFSIKARYSILPLRNPFQLLSVTSALNPRPAVGWAIAVVRTQTKASVAAHVASAVRVFDLAERVCVDYRH